MQKKLFTLFLATVASVGTLFAESGTCGAQGDNLTWDLTDGVLTISGTGEMNNYSYPSYGPWYSSRSSIRTVVINAGVTSIGEETFYNCSSLTSVTIPNSVTSIGWDAFGGCSSLPVTNNLRYADTYLVEAVDKTLSTYTIKAGTRWIGDRAFYNCGLTSVTIPSSVTSIGESAFYGCSSLTSVTIPNSVTTIGGDSVFCLCSGLTSITCEAVTPPTLRSESNVHDVDKSIPLYVPYESIEAYKSADQWKEFTNILPICPIASGTCGVQGDNLTWELSCDSVLTISGTGKMKEYNDLYSYWAGTWYDNRSLIKSVVINEGVTNIGGTAFTGCENLISVVIPISVTSIGGDAFGWCTSLDSIDLPNNITNLPDSLFAGCTALTSVIIPENVTSIGTQAFMECTSLTSITCKAVTPPVCNMYTFEDVDKSISLYVPYESIEAYKAADGWKEFTNILPIQGTGPKTYTITWQDEDGNPIKVDEVAYGEMPVFSGEVPTKAATAEYTYEFAGWLPKISAVTKDICYTTFFERNKIEPTVYNVNINGENCSLHISNELPAGTTLQVEAVADECFEFEKWSDGETANPRTITVTEDSDLTAEFNKVTYTITGETENEGGEVQIIP